MIMVAMITPLLLITLLVDYYLNKGIIAGPPIEAV
jgi:hypothetical protein